jgi:hypothetical protein
VGRDEGATAAAAASAARSPRTPLEVWCATTTSEQRRTQTIGRLSLHRRRHVAVEIGEQRRVRVAQPLGGNLGRDAASQHQRGARVAQAVGGEARQVSQDREVCQLPGQRLRVIRAAADASEGVVAVDVGARSQALFSLALALVPEDHHELWWRELQLLLVAYSGLRWGEHTGLVGSQFDVDRRRISVSRQIIDARSGLIPSLPKGRQQRVTMFPEVTPAGGGSLGAPTTAA